jgi:predicted DCC family thiol-disulfide oxidoreductase YuxK
MLGSEYRPGRPEVAYLVAHDGEIRRGLDAILPLLARITGGRWLAVFLGMPVIKPVGFWLYRFVAHNRYRWFGAVDGNPR